MTRDTPLINITRAEETPQQCCGNCALSRPIRLTDAVVSCRAQLPALVMIDPRAGAAMGAWPPVEAKDGWCAQWKEKPVPANKLQ